MGSPKPPVTLLASPAMALKLVDTALPMALFAVADSDMATLAPTNPMAMAILVPDTEATELAITEDLPEQLCGRSRPPRSNSPWRSATSLRRSAIRGSIARVDSGSREEPSHVG